MLSWRLVRASSPLRRRRRSGTKSDEFQPRLLGPAELLRPAGPSHQGPTQSLARYFRAWLPSSERGLETVGYLRADELCEAESCCHSAEQQA